MGEGLSPWAVFKARWGRGCGDGNCARAFRVCLARGTIPADIVFVGEAPGVSEDTLGEPFRGPAGKLLDRIITAALKPVEAQRATAGKPPLRLCWTNLAGCMPRDEKGSKSGEPEHEQVMACRPRLEEFLELAAPRLICCVGKLSEEYLRPGFRDSVKTPGVPIVNVVHPAFILRATFAQQGLLAQRCVVTIRNAADRL